MRQGLGDRARTAIRPRASRTSPSSAALIWLSIGNAYRAALDPQAALHAFQRAESVAPAGSPTNREAAAGKVAAAAAIDDPVEAELRKLQGRWLPVRIEADGKSMEGKKGRAPVSIRFSRWTEKSVEGEATVKFTIDPAKDPKHITLMHGATAIPGIYALEGEQLKVSMAFPFG